MKKILSLIIIGLLCLSMFSMYTPYLGQAETSETPVTEWDETYGGTGDDEANCVIQTSDGGYALAGRTESSPGDWDAWLVKTDAAGNMAWNQTYRGPGTSHDFVACVVQTNGGGYALAGHTGFMSYNAGSIDFWLIKTSSNGDMLWNKTYGGAYNDGAQSVIQTSDGGYAIAGMTESFGAGKPDKTDFWLIKTDSAGNMEWNQTYDGNKNTDAAYSVVQTDDGGYAIAGRTRSFGAGLDDGWLVKTDVGGNAEWNQTYGGTNWDRVDSMIQASDGGYVLAGHIQYGSDEESLDFWLVKTDPDGNMAWNQTYGGTSSDSASSVVQTNDEGYALAGRTKSEGAGGWDFWLVKTDSAGNMQWNETYGGANEDRAFSVIQTSDGGYAIAGMTKSFGAGSNDFWLVKLAPECIQMASWPMFRHDLYRTGYSTSEAPNTNNTIWSYATGHTAYSSPAVYDGVVYVGSRDHNLYALNQETGAQIWSFTTEGRVYSSPAVACGKVFFGAYEGDHNVYCLNAKNGTKIWNYTTGSWIKSSPVVVDGRVFIGSSDNKVYCLNASTGAKIWSYTTDGDVESSPAVVDGKVYVGSGDDRVYCIDAIDGAQIWNYTTNGNVHSSPAVAYGRIFVGSGGGDGRVYCLNATTGEHKWNFTTGSYVESSPAVAYGRVYVGSSDHHLYCLNAFTGGHIWNYTTGGPVDSSPAVADGKVFVGSYDNWVYCLNALTKAKIWSYETGGSVHSSPAVAYGGVFVGSNDFKVYAFACTLEDNTAPVTTIHTAGASGNEGWFVSDVNVTLTATDDMSGIAETLYRVNEGSWNTYETSFIVTTGGTSTVDYYSIDNAGNVEEQRSETINIDKTPPTVAILCPVAFGIYAAISDDTYDFTATDNLDPQPTISAVVYNFEENVYSHPNSGDPLPCESGVYTLVVSATDEAGHNSTQGVTFVIYDQNAGFTTGGGWIIPEPEEGDNKATFGFVAKYHKGSTTPDGNLEFQYNYQDTNLKSTEIQWLVISNNKAIFQGTATINREGLYTFRVHATDGDLTGDQPDNFKIKIWQGTDTETDPIHDYQGQLAGGNIKVHK